MLNRFSGSGTWSTTCFDVLCWHLRSEISAACWWKFTSGCDLLGALSPFLAAGVKRVWISVFSYWKRQSILNECIQRMWLLIGWLVHIAVSWVFYPQHENSFGFVIVVYSIGVDGAKYHVLSSLCPTSVWDMSVFVSILLQLVLHLQTWCKNKGIDNVELMYKVQLKWPVTLTQSCLSGTLSNTLTIKGKTSCWWSISNGCVYTTTSCPGCHDMSSICSAENTNGDTSEPLLNQKLCQMWQLCVSLHG